MMKVLRSSETSVLTRATRHNIPEDGILHSHFGETLKSYKPRGLRDVEIPILSRQLTDNFKHKFI
jgi:hypothetical protein